MESDKPVYQNVERPKGQCIRVRQKGGSSSFLTDSFIHLTEKNESNSIPFIAKKRE